MAGKNSFFKSKAFMTILSFLGLYLLSTGASWAIFSYVGGEPHLQIANGTSERRVQIEGLPKTEKCPINGKLYTEPERAIWEERRPLTVIIENHAEARPLEGLSRADVVYEAVAEGGITRYLGVFYCGVAVSDTRIAAVRSARVYFISWAAEYGDNPLFVHVGGANNICKDCPGGVKPPGDIAREVDAFRILELLGWRVAGGNDLDTHLDSDYPELSRDLDRLGKKIAMEHTMVGKTDYLYKEAQGRGFGYEDENGEPWNENYIAWKFVDDDPVSVPKYSDISFEFWGNWADYNVRWEYDSVNNRYIRYNGGHKQIDGFTDEEITAKNVVVQFVKERGPVDKEKHMFYTTIGTGKVLIFQNGDVIDGTWEKQSQTSRTRYYDGGGKEINFVRGEIWIEALPLGNEVEY